LPRLTVESLGKSYGRISALENATLQVEDGEYVVILGPSGCGKSTLLKCIAGITKSDTGSIWMGDRRIDGLPPEERGVGYVFQNVALFPHMSVWDNVVYGPRVRAVPAHVYRPIVFEMLDVVRLSVGLEQYPSSLSGGAAQKVSLTRCLVSGVELLLLDEPLSALDTRVRVQLRYELRRIVKEAKLTALHVTHDQEEAMAIADRIIVMNNARIVETGTPEELYLKPKELFTAQFLGEANLLKAKVVGLSPEGSILEIGGNVLRGPKLPEVRDAYCTVIVRPEFVNLNPSEGEIEGRVGKKSFAGSYFKLEVEVGNICLESKVSRKSVAASLKEGNKVRVRIMPENMIVFWP
jgi:ABC-type Fe3+/spermidine/putrescine transport system ATPase subunit